MFSDSNPANEINEIEALAEGQRQIKTSRLDQVLEH